MSERNSSRTVQAQIGEVLDVGTRVRHKRHPDLTGRVAGHEYGPQGLSPLPYAVDWDDSDLASETLGWFFMYASNDTVEVVG